MSAKKLPFSEIYIKNLPVSEFSLLLTSTLVPGTSRLQLITCTRTYGRLEEIERNIAEPLSFPKRFVIMYITKHMNPLYI